MFGGKGQFVNFYETGDELFEIMCRLEASMRVQSFFVMDENFLLYRKRALRLLELMRRGTKVLVALRVQLGQRAAPLHHGGAGRPRHLLGLDGPRGEGRAATRSSRASTPARWSRELQAQRHPRARVDHRRARRSTRPRTSTRPSSTPWPTTPSSTSSCCTRPLPGTPLYARAPGRGHAPVRRGVRRRRRARTASVQLPAPVRSATARRREFLLRAFRRDFEVNGPSVTRIARTLLRGWRRHKTPPRGAGARPLRARVRRPLDRVLGRRLGRGKALPA